MKMPFDRVVVARRLHSKGIVRQGVRCRRASALSHFLSGAGRASRWGIGIRVGHSYREIGTGSFLHCFFSTVSAVLEPRGWGSRFPTLMNRLYQGDLPDVDVEKARSELVTVRRELAAHPPSAVVWDIADRSQRPPWGDAIAPEITSLANYFVTSNGKDLFDVLLAALDEAAQSGRGTLIQ